MQAQAPESLTNHRAISQTGMSLTNQGILKQSCFWRVGSISTEMVLKHQAHGLLKGLEAEAEGSSVMAHSLPEL